MKDELLIVYKSILPDYFESVLKAKSLVEDSKMSVCEACKEVDISRSTFYKYKDKIFRATEQYGKKSIITVKTADKKGVLGAILDIVYDFGANVIAINQAMSVRGVYHAHRRRYGRRYRRVRFGSGDTQHGKRQKRFDYGNRIRL